MCRSLTIAPLYQAPTCFPAKLGMCVPLSPFLSFCKKCLCCSLCYSWCELFIWHPDTCTSKTLPGTLSKPFCQPCHRVLSTLREVLSSLCSSVGAPFRSGPGSVPKMLTDKGERVGGKGCDELNLYLAPYLLAIILWQCATIWIVYILSVFILFLLFFCILTLAYSLFFLVIFNPWQQLLF